MDTKVFVSDPHHPNEQAIDICSRILLEGGLVAFPTETVYGLGANALNAEAVKKIFLAKGRPQDNPLILHVLDMGMAKEYVTDIPVVAQVLAKAFWPGPLSMIFKKSGVLPPVVTAGLDTVAVRVPDHPVALALIRGCNVPISAPSANTSGRPSPTDGSHVMEDLSGKIDAIIDSGKCRIGLESTVVDLTVHPPRVLRPGGIPFSELSILVKDIEKGFSKAVEEKPRSPGMKYAHYSPDSPMVVVKGDPLDVAGKINALASASSRPGILCSRETYDLYPTGQKLCVGSLLDPGEIAGNLFECFRLFNKLDVDIIYSEYFEILYHGEAVMDRLMKASGYQLIHL
ncbi:MAG: L-threonylcarbamoyladenylate synthase [Clostridia bacterium]